MSKALTSGLTIDPASELRCRLAAQAWKCRLTFLKFKKLCEWLDCYQYINPDDRKLAPFSIIVGDLSAAYTVWKFADILHCCLTTNEQEIVWKLINES